MAFLQRQEYRKRVVTVEVDSWGVTPEELSPRAEAVAMPAREETVQEVQVVQVDRGLLQCWAVLAAAAAAAAELAVLHLQGVASVVWGSGEVTEPLVPAVAEAAVMLDPAIPNRPVSVATVGRDGSFYTHKVCRSGSGSCSSVCSFSSRTIRARVQCPNILMSLQ